MSKEWWNRVGVPILLGVFIALGGLVIGLIIYLIVLAIDYPVM